MKSTLKSIKDYAKLCNVSTQAINYRIREGLIKPTIIELLGTEIVAIDTELYPPTKLRNDNNSTK